MEGHNAAGVLTVAASVLLLSTAAYGWRVVPEYYDWDVYFAHTEDENDYADAACNKDFPYCRAVAYAFLEAPQTTLWGVGYAYMYWKIYTTDYDPEEDPTLTAHVGCSCWTIAYAMYDLESSDYHVSGAGTGYAGPYTAWTAVEFTEPDDGDVEADYFNETIDMSSNGETIFFNEFAYASVTAYSTEDVVKLYAYGESDCWYWIEEGS